MNRSIGNTYLNCNFKITSDRDLGERLRTHLEKHARDVGWRLRRCSDDHNIWFVKADYGWLHGRYWQCRSKLCSYCLSTESRSRRKKLKLALESYGSQRLSEWRFVTFTIENPSTSLLQTREIVNESWSKFRKRVCFAPVVAAAKSEEFTLTKIGFHYHVHLLAHLSDRVDYQSWRKNWTECVESSGGKSTRLFGYETIDGYLIVDIRKLQNLNSITNELCKYVTKSTSFSSLSNDALLELAAVKRWHRMFEFIGNLKPPKRETKLPGKSRSVIVHNSRLTDGCDSDRWWFEKKRSIHREYHKADLSATFKSDVFTVAEFEQFYLMELKQNEQKIEN